MEQNLFTLLSLDMKMNIFSRLPVVSIMRCKCVCKSWLDLLRTHDFVKSHLSKSVPGILQGKTSSKPYRLYEFVDVLNNPQSSTHYLNAVLDINFSFRQYEVLCSSTNGLLFVSPRAMRHHYLFICNPITRDYVKLPDPQESCSSKFELDTYGFGVSKISGEYKTVRIFKEFIPNPIPHQHQHQSVCCQVYTLGTGSWRSVAAGRPLSYSMCQIGVSLNGNIHWLANELDGFLSVISCFDLETEVFSTVSTPTRLITFRRSLSIYALGECLSLCSHSCYEQNSVIWLLNDYEDEKSWTKILVISGENHLIDWNGDFVWPIKVFKNGDILIAVGRNYRLLCYSNKTRTIQGTGVVLFDVYRYPNSALSYTPSFVSLKAFEMVENVSSF